MVQVVFCLDLFLTIQRRRYTLIVYYQIDIKQKAIEIVWELIESTLPYTFPIRIKHNALPNSQVAPILILTA